MRELALNSGWRLHEAPLCWDKGALAEVSRLPQGWLQCDLPCDVHMPLQAAGIIRDPVKAEYSFESEWIEKRSWWFEKRFDGAEVDVDADAVELTLESIDARADVFLNGVWLGEHFSAHYPFVAGVKGRILPGENVLCVRVTTGLERVSDADLAEINWTVCTEAGNGCPERGDLRRAFVRRPQYSVGWDWGPKCLTCGIVKGVYIRAYRKTAIRGAHLTTRELRDGAAELKLELAIDQLDILGSRDADARVEMRRNGEICASAEARDLLLRSGLNYIDIPLRVEDAMLWWPAGYGEQPLYDVSISLSCEDHVERCPDFSYGIRTVALDTRRVGGDERDFRLIVNGVAVYCKGGNWIPADSVYARVSKEKYETLISEAREANFNMLRVWGGGIYETDSFYEACDRMGIMLWHDFMLACAAYPDHLPWFRREIEREQEYQVARLRNHPCLALWCGNNENHSMTPHWDIDARYERQFGLLASNEISPRVVRKLSPEIPYWNSSPYGGRSPDDGNVGDVHHWGACMMNRDMRRRIEPKEYDRVRARFVSEYGYPGPCRAESIDEYLDGAPADRASRAWDAHNNTFEKRTVNAGIEKQYAVDASALSMEEYLLYAGMVQSLMLGYSLEALRFKDYCGGGLFWMYDDTWGEVGWTIIDYYLRRKISYYGVKRAFAPVRIALREEDGVVCAQGLNDTADEIAFEARIGYMRFDGTEAKLRKARIVLPPHSRQYVLSEPLTDDDYRLGTYFVIPERGIEPAALRMYDLKELALPGAKPRIEKAERVGDDQLITLYADGYIHGVYLDTPCRCSDNYFDMIPGQRKRVTVYGARDARLDALVVPLGKL